MIARFIVCCTALALVAQGARAQAPAPAPVKKQLKPKLRIRIISFPTAKPVLGLPADDERVSRLCSSAGLTYFDTGAGSTTPADLYTVSATAEVKHFRRKLPVGFTEVTIDNFYPSEHGVVALLEAVKRDSYGSRPITEYFLSTSDQDGDQSDLISLSLRFKPLRIAAFNGGDFVVLGWDTANQLPILATLKPDGTVRRFLDLGEMQRATASAVINADLLSKAAFVPYGGDVLLTFPGTTQPMQVLRDVGQGGSISIEIPAGFFVHDVLGSDGRITIVVRLEALPPKLPPEDKTEAKPEAKPEEKPKAKLLPPLQRLLEYSTTGGDPLWEYVFGKVPISAITCAAKQSLTGAYFDMVGTPVKDGVSPDSTPTQLMVGTARR